MHFPEISNKSVCVVFFEAALYAIVSRAIAREEALAITRCTICVEASAGLIIFVTSVPLDAAADIGRVIGTIAVSSKTLGIC